MKKLLVVALAGLLLGGCTLAKSQQEAAKDEKPAVVTNTETKTELSQTEDPKLQAVPSVDNDNSLEGIEEDMTNTEFFDEDFGDLEL